MIVGWPRSSSLYSGGIGVATACRSVEIGYVNLSPFVSPDDWARRSPPSPPRHVHTPTLVCHVPRYQYITERPPEIRTLYGGTFHSPNRGTRDAGRETRAHAHTGRRRTSTHAQTPDLTSSHVSSRAPSPRSRRRPARARAVARRSRPSRHTPPRQQSAAGASREGGERRRRARRPRRQQPLRPRPHRLRTLPPRRTDEAEPAHSVAGKLAHRRHPPHARRSVDVK